MASTIAQTFLDTTCVDTPADNPSRLAFQERCESLEEAEGYEAASEDTYVKSKRATDAITHLMKPCDKAEGLCSDHGEFSVKGTKEELWWLNPVTVSSVKSLIEESTRYDRYEKLQMCLQLDICSGSPRSRPTSSRPMFGPPVPPGFRRS